MPLNVTVSQAPLPGLASNILVVFETMGLTWTVDTYKTYVQL